MIGTSARGAWTEVESHLRPFVARRVDNPADVPDVLQDIYLRVQAGLAGLQDTERFGPWVYQVARSALADLARSRARHHLSGVSEANAAETVAPAIDEEDGEAERALATYMVTFVAALPSPYREAILLTELQEMSQKDAASMLGTSLSAMKSRVRRGRQLIQEMLRACCDIALDARGRVVSYDRRADGKAPKDCCPELKDCKC
ncbi:MAG: sigma-70 family RNA polymerase sigma factor [Myxococcales bacterium]